MKNTFLILISIIAINTMAQKDTIYFNKHWEKGSKEKAGDLYRVNDYYINGNPQMEGFWSNLKMRN